MNFVPQRISYINWRLVQPQTIITIEANKLANYTVQTISKVQVMSGPYRYGIFYNGKNFFLIILRRVTL